MKLAAGKTAQGGRDHIIKRPRLTRLLDETEARVILLVAPAGYGKTTLAREWLADRPHGWYRGTTATADVAALALGLANAASAVVPGAGEHLKQRLRISEAPAQEVERLAELLAEDLADWPGRAWLTFDDYQFACDSEPPERFVEHLASSCGVQLIVTSRTRPRWATARRVLYGEILEVGRNLLAMHPEEAQSLLSDHSVDETGALLSFSDGWPALIGLATLSGSVNVPGEALPEELYDFFAEELYRAAEPDLQQALRRFALAPYVTSDIAETVAGDQSDRFIDGGLELGFFLPGRERLELHPLLRSFLASKFRTRQDDPIGRIVTDLARVLIVREEWDDVFELASRFANDSVLIELFEASLPQILDQARLPTLARWIAAAQSRSLDSPLVDLAEAELAFRRGEHQRAEAFACQAARRFPENGRFASRSFWVAGTSAHVSVKDEAALKHFSAAERTATSDSDARSAVWGQFLATEALQREEDAEALLDNLSTRSASTPDELLRIATGRFLMTSLLCDVQSAIDSHSLVSHLVDRSHDPVIQTGFLNAYAGLLAVAGQYEDALREAERQASIALKYSLDFVIPFAQLHAAAARWGLRSFQACRANLASCERCTDNSRLLTHAGQLRARMCLATQRHDEALESLDRVHHAAKASLPMHAEHLAWWSLTHALAGHQRDAVSLAKRAAALSRRIEVSALVPWTKAVLASGKATARRSAGAAFDTAISTGNIDAFVTAYRAHPDLLQLLAGDSSKHERLRIILERAQDDGLAKHVGLPLPRTRVSDGESPLSSREREVMELLSQGLLNKEIARTLFIAEGTVKVHVRRICRKLGARTRTEAVMRAAELSG